MREAREKEKRCGALPVRKSTEMVLGTVAVRVIIPGWEWEGHHQGIPRIGEVLNETTPGRKGAPAAVQCALAKKIARVQRGLRYPRRRGDAVRTGWLTSGEARNVIFPAS